LRLPAVNGLIGSKQFKKRAFDCRSGPDFCYATRQTDTGVGKGRDARGGMPTIKVDDCELNVVVEGSAHAPTLMLSNSLGTDLRMWDPQVKRFAERFRLIRYDRRGHGKSSVPPGPYSMERLGRDVIGILDALGVETIDWCGLSMGGMVGQWLGANAPQRIRRLVLANTSCYYPVKDPWDDRIAAAASHGLAPMLDATMQRWFTADFIEREPQLIEGMKAMMLATPLAGYIGCCAAVRDMDHRDLLPRITAPTLVIAGRHDVATPLAAGDYIRSRIPDATLAILEAGHLSNIERSAEFTDQVMGFLR
jgi:3-oxoadipate enol-lactonase